MKKTLSAVMIASLLLANSCALPVFAEGEPSFSVSNAKGKAGEEVTISIDISNNPGIISCLVKAEYDSEALTLKNASVKDFEAATFGPLNKDPFTISWGDAIHGDNTTNGTLAELTFTINDDAEAGTYPISLSYDEDDVFNTSFSNVDFSTIDGWVTVETTEVSVEGITVSPTEKTLKAEGESFTLVPSVTPANATNKNVSFISSDPSVAVVDVNGKVTAVANGTAVITVKTEDGGKTADCTVTVDIPHVHTLKKIAAKASTCTKKGNNEYYVCEECGKYFKDENGVTETTPENESLPLEKHKGGKATCTEKAVCEVCGSEYGELAAHKFTAENTDPKYLSTEADCTHKAVYYYSCGVCGAAGTETFEYGEVDPDNHSGNVKIVGQKEATCQEEGYTGDTVCTDCNTVIIKGEVIPVGGHTPSNVWSTDSESHWKECTFGCGNIIDKSAHEGGTATCHSKAVCAVCGIEYGELDPDNHDGKTEIRDAVAATTTSEGYTGDTYCLGCGEKIAEGKVIEKLDHEHIIKKVEAKAATATEDGNIEYYTCENCGKLYKDAGGLYEITAADVVIKAYGSDSSISDNSSTSTSVSDNKSSAASSANVSSDKSGNSSASNANPNTGVGSAAMAAGVIALGALVVAKKKK